MTELEKGLAVMALIPTIVAIILGYFSYKKYKSKAAKDGSDFIT